jgi:acetylornithine deacetylase
MSSQHPSETALAAITRQASSMQDDATAFLRKLVACETAVRSPVTTEFLAETKKCRDLVAGMLESLSCEVHAWETLNGYPTLAARHAGSGEGNSLTFNGHIDVVPVGDTSAWTRDPWAGEIEDGKLYGRGTADMKAGLVSMIFALKSLQEAGYRPAGDVWFHVVSDEELVGLGTRECIERFPATDAVLDAEPTDLIVIPTEGGLEHLRIEIEGREAHAGSRWRNLAPGEDGPGVNAVEKGVKLVTAIQDLERQWVNRKSHPLFPPGYNSILPAIFIGGPGGGADGQLNVVNNPGTMANYCAIEYNIWYYPDESCAQVKADFEAFVHAVCQTDEWLREHPPKLTWGLRQVTFPAFETAPDHPFIDLLTQNVQRAGTVPDIKGFSAASDLAWYAQAEMPGSLFGPGGIAQAHSPDEFVSLADFHRATEICALQLATWCGVEKA